MAPAQRTVRSFSLASGAVRAVSDAGFGRLTIVSNTLWAVEPLVRAIGEFRRLQPGVRFVLTDPTSRSDVLDLVRSGEADLGLVDGTPPSGQLDSRWLVDHELVAVLPPGTAHRLLTVGVSELVPLGLISTPRGTAMRTLLDEQLEAAGTATEVAIETAHVASVIPLVLAGAGVAILPEGMAAKQPPRARGWCGWIRRRGRRCPWCGDATASVPWRSTSSWSPASRGPTATHSPCL